MLCGCSSATRARRCITAVNIPLALLIAFIGMVVTGTPANLISLGAVDFGIVVDSTVIMVENIFRHLGRARPRHDAGAHPRRGAARSAPPMFVLDADHRRRVHSAVHA